MIPSIIADYKEQRSAFDELCNPACENKILIFEGESGCGKTSLLHDCLNRIPDEMTHISFDGKETTFSVSEIFSRSVCKFGWTGLSEFRESVLSLSNKTTVNIQDIKQKGDKNTINLALRAEREEDKKYRQTLLTEAWFSDVGKLDSKLLVIFDTFEKAGSDVINWFSGPFLSRVPDTPQIRVLIAGQKTPEHTIVWDNCCKHYNLLGVSDANEWMPVVDAMERCINVENPIDWLAGVCYTTKGSPEAIIKIIETLPLKEN